MDTENGELLGFDARLFGARRLVRGFLRAFRMPLHNLATRTLCLDFLFVLRCSFVGLFCTTDLLLLERPDHRRGPRTADGTGRPPRVRHRV